MQYVPNLTIENALNKKDKLNFISATAITINLNFSKLKLQLQVTKLDDKIITDEYFELLLYILPEHKSVNKIIIFLKQIL